MTRPFCPHGYLTSQVAILRAALHWFPEEIAALDTATARELAIPDKRNSDNQEPTSVEALARALASPPSISEILRQQIADVLIKTEHRLRSFLHQRVATARRVIEALYPNGVPDAATESNKKLCKRVSEALSEAVSDDTILRAAGRRK